ncbi:MAG: hypothetical protein U9Q83_04840 [Bacteroidota bacterium]|nr:hypothetical protein [Bacteroidota bacterium]
MKKLFFILALGIFFIASCTNDAEVKEKITGEWVIMDDNPETNEPLHYIFQENGHYKRYWTEPDIDQQEGVWSLEKSKLSIFVIGVPIKYKYIITGDILTLEGIKYKKVK